MINIQFDYIELFTVKILHDYYNKETTSDFKIIPTPETSILCKKLGVIIKQVDNKFFILIEQEKMELLDFPLFAESKFSFLIYNSLIYFKNFTNISIESSSDKILYFHNKNQKSEARSIFSLDSEEIVYLKNDQNFSCIDFFAKHKPIALAEIFFTDLSQQNISRNYCIKFSSRQTFWKYAFIKKNLSDNEIEIVTREGLPVRFIKHKNEILLHKCEAIIFISENPIPVKEFYTHRFSLITKNKMDKTIEIIPTLPLPGIEMIKSELKLGVVRMISEVVIYL